MCPTVSLPLGRKREPHTFVPDVPSSVNVAVMGATAQGARPLPNRQVLGSREAVAALMTELARREQPTDGDETLAPVFELVAEKGAEHAEAVVHRGLAELQAPGHVHDVSASRSVNLEQKRDRILQLPKQQDDISITEETR